MEKKHFNQKPLTEYFQFGLSVDCVIFGYEQGSVKVLLIKRGAEPYKGMWSIPGDLVYLDEEIDDASRRVLVELTGLKSVFMDQIRTFGGVNRHTDGRVVTVVYYALMPLNQSELIPSSWASSAEWLDIHNVPNLAFDHNEIYAFALSYLQNEFRNSLQLGFELLPEKFTLLDYHQLSEFVLGESIDKANLRKKILSSNLVEPLEEIQSNVNHRPAKLFKLKEEISD